MDAVKFLLSVGNRAGAMSGDLQLVAEQFDPDLARIAAIAASKLSEVDELLCLACMRTESVCKLNLAKTKPGPPPRNSKPEPTPKIKLKLREFRRLCPMPTFSRAASAAEKAEAPATKTSEAAPARPDIPARETRERSILRDTSNRRSETFLLVWER
jgi:hypothetical protein